LRHFHPTKLSVASVTAVFINSADLSNGEMMILQKLCVQSEEYVSRLRFIENRQGVSMFS